MVDGAVARVTKTASKFGAYLDTIVDRYVEAIIAFGLLFAALPGFYIPAYAWIFLYLFGGMMTTYAKAAAKEGGHVAGVARKELEERTGESIVTTENYLPDPDKNRKKLKGKKKK